MEVGIGLPNAVRGVDRAGIVEWARRAEAEGFASLGTLDRIVYPSYESLIVLAAAAAVTERIGLMTDILIAPLRANTALFAKQAATIDALSGGRLTLGLAVGGRPDDYEVSEVDFRSRGQRFDRQLEQMTAIWNGDRGIGPTPARGARPGLLIGGHSDAAFRRAASYADGWTMGGGGPDALAGSMEKLNAAWSAAGRDGKPRTAALFYFALGDDAEQTAHDSLSEYYSFLGDIGKQIAAGAATDAATVKQYLAAFEAAGADEVICFPASANPEQVDRLADAAFG
ncbi:MAG TPA: LLM class flavin-dependent oxidoreductase [Solirubrobacteraceae bacterium]|nr:LLM class flavin-dependent oxidoreductase [Solirubrobacteraceae bacterium]